MADSAQYFIELLADDLCDLTERGLLNEEEVKQVSKQISTCEYRLQRRISKKQDFLYFIDYLKSLESLLKLRRSRLGLADKSSSSSDGMCPKKIHQIFSRALRKFKADLELWKSYIQYCMKCESTNVLSRIFADALMHHPLEQELWIMAAEWEMQHNSNMPAARTMLHRALRLMPQSHDIWLAYFKLELMYWDKLNKRKELMLGQQSLQINHDPGCSNTESIVVPELEEEKNEAEPNNSFSSPNFLDTEDILIVIFDHATSTIEDFSFSKRFLQIFDDLLLYPEHSYSVIFEKIREKFSKFNSQLIPFLLERDWQRNEKTEKNFNLIMDKFKDAIEKEKESELLVQLISFIKKNKSFVPDLDVCLFGCFSLIESNQLFDKESLFVEWIEFLNSKGMIKEALKASDYSLSSIRSSSKLWELRIRLCLTATEEYSVETLEMFANLITKALTDIPSFHSTQIRLLYLQILDQFQSLFPPQLLLSIQQSIVTQSRLFIKDHSVQILSWYLRWFNKQWGVEKTRLEYKKLKSNWLYAHSFIECIIEFEKELSEPQVSILTELYDELLSTTCDDDKLSVWIDYLEWLIIDLKDYLTASKVYTKAIGTLDKNSEAMYSLIVTFNSIKNQ